MSEPNLLQGQPCGGDWTTSMAYCPRLPMNADDLAVIAGWYADGFLPDVVTKSNDPRPPGSAGVVMDADIDITAIIYRRVGPTGAIEQRKLMVCSGRAGL